MRPLTSEARQFSHSQVLLCKRLPMRASGEWPVEVVSVRDQVIYDSPSGTAPHTIDLTPNAQIRKRKKAPGECASRPNQFDTRASRRTGEQAVCVWVNGRISAPSSIESSVDAN